jgi:hypothetical protein
MLVGAGGNAGNVRMFSMNFYTIHAQTATVLTESFVNQCAASERPSDSRFGIGDA